MAPKTQSEPQVPYRQIRALYDDETITVYQAYNTEIASAAVQFQRLDASPLFSASRMTWIKPSWCWMMYRSGYSLKDAGQARILAIKVPHAYFRELLMNAAVCGKERLGAQERKGGVRVQWDPERSPKLGMLGWRSIQVGISGVVGEKWVKEGIVGIEDVTDKALGLMEAVKGGEVTRQELEERGLWPVERIYEVDDELRRVLKMEEKGE